MIKPEQIPIECREAFYQAYWKSGLPSHAALAAAINAWPGMEKLYRQPHRLAVDYSHPEIILPLPQEARDD